MTYNPSGQLASTTWSGAGFAVAGSLQYSYSTTQNNGQIAQVVDSISGETILYQYDSLRQLTSSASTPSVGISPTAWTQTFQSDGFGNLTAKVLNGSTTSIGVDASTNRLSSASYDANGHMTSGAGATFTFDVANRNLSAAEVSGGVEYYGYAPDNKRIYKKVTSGAEEYTFYGAQGKKLGVYNLTTGTASALRTTVWLAGKLISENSGAGFQDSVGTNRAGGARFYPYGDEISSTANDRQKYGTYTRDSYTGLDYAQNRYYASGLGRFATADSGYTGALSDPRSLNLYSYVLGDPVNGNDPQGLCSVIGSGITQSAYSDSTTGQQEFANEVGGISVTPYSNGSLLSGVASVIVQGMGFPAGAIATWLNAISLAARNPGPISTYAFSGSGGAFTNAYAYNWLTPEVQARITSIAYIDPGNFNQPLTSGTPGTNVSLYTDNSDAANLAVQLFGSGPTGTVNTFNTSPCGHNENCVYNNFADQLSQTATNCTLGAGAVFGLPPRNYIYSSGFNWYNYFWSEPAPVPFVTSTIHYDLP